MVDTADTRCIMRLSLTWRTDMNQRDLNLIDRLLDIAELDNIDHNICDDAREAAVRLRQLIDYLDAMEGM